MFVMTMACVSLLQPGVKKNVSDDNRMCVFVTARCEFRTLVTTISCMSLLQPGVNKNVSHGDGMYVFVTARGEQER